MANTKIIMKIEMISGIVPIFYDLYTVTWLLLRSIGMRNGCTLCHLEIKRLECSHYRFDFLSIFKACVGFEGSDVVKISGSFEKINQCLFIFEGALYM